MEVRPVQAECEQKEQKERDAKIEALRRKLRVVANAADSYKDYCNFQKRFVGVDKIISQIDQYVATMLLMKAAVKSDFDNGYLSIDNPPEALQQNLRRAYEQLDGLSDAVLESFGDIVTTLNSLRAGGQVPAAPIPPVPAVDNNQLLP